MHTRRNVLTAAATLLVAAVAPPAFAQDARSGVFKGESRHVTTGTATLRKTADGYVVELGADFTFDGAPDPKVALGRNGYDKNTLMGALAQDTGAQSYPVPAGIDAAQYNEVWIWCERFNVPLGLAKLN